MSSLSEETTLSNQISCSLGPAVPRPSVEPIRITTYDSIEAELALQEHSSTTEYYFPLASFKVVNFFHLDSPLLAPLLFEREFSSDDADADVAEPTEPFAACVAPRAIRVNQAWAQSAVPYLWRHPTAKVLEVVLSERCTKYNRYIRHVDELL